jgi:hypothetical protein
MISDYSCGYTSLIRRGRPFHWLNTILILCSLGLAGRTLGSQSVELTWNASPSLDIMSYKIYYGTQSGVYRDFVTVADISDVAVPGLQDGQTYYFAVSAVDGEGYESALSPEAVYTVPWPSTVSLQVVTSTAALQAVDAIWTPSPDNDVFAYVVSYGTESGVYTNSVTFDFVTDGVIAGLVPGGTYYFIVTPIDSLGVALGSSAEVSYLVPVPAPIVLNATALPGGGGVQLSWTDLSGQGATGYNIYYGTQDGLYTGSTQCGLRDNITIQGLQSGETYNFVVAAVDSYGDQGVFSNDASVELSALAPAPAGIRLQLQTFTDASGHPNYLEITSPSQIFGLWEMDYSPDLVNWTPYVYGYGSGNPDGGDVFVGAAIDPNVPQMFFRVIQ